MNTFEIYFSDLTPEAQDRYLAAAGVSSADELNHEVMPSGEVTKVYTVDFDTYDNPTPTTTEDSSGGLLEAVIMCTDVFPLPPDSDIDRVLKEYEKRNSK